MGRIEWAGQGGRWDGMAAWHGMGWWHGLGRDGAMAWHRQGVLKRKGGTRKADIVGGRAARCSVSKLVKLIF